MYKQILGQSQASSDEKIQTASPRQKVVQALKT